MEVKMVSELLVLALKLQILVDREELTHGQVILGFKGANLKRFRSPPVESWQWNDCWNFARFLICLIFGFF